MNNANEGLGRGESGVTGIPSARSRTRSKNGNTTSSATSASSNARRTSRSVAEILSSLNVAFPVKPESAVVKRLLSDSNMTYSNLFTADLLRIAHCIVITVATSGAFHVIADISTERTFRILKGSISIWLVFSCLLFSRMLSEHAGVLVYGISVN